MVGCMLSFAAFYVLQKRELKRFYETREAQRKEQQVSQVLNAQSDAIFLVDADVEGQHNREIVVNEDYKPNFEFCNSRSVELFGFDLASINHLREDVSLQTRAKLEQLNHRQFIA